MAQLKKVVEPFGEVNVYPSGGKVRVVATILMEPHKEGAQTGIALDGSGSMSKLYGVESSERRRIPRLVVRHEKAELNEVTPVAQKVCSYLAQDRRRRRHHLHLLGGRAGRQSDRVGR